MHTTLSFTEQAEAALAATRTAHVSVGVLQAAVAVALIAESLAPDERTQAVAGETVAALLGAMDDLCPDPPARPGERVRPAPPRPRPAPVGPVERPPHEGCLDPS
jgi:Tfp pilus assembly protein FimV